MFTFLIETNISHINFIILFLAMFLYWLKSTLFLSKTWYFLPNLSLIISSILQTISLFLRWIITNHFPLSNLYESLLFLSWSLTICTICLNVKFSGPFLKPITALFNKTFQNKTQQIKFELENQTIVQPKFKAFSNEQFMQSLFGSILTPLIFLMNTFATFCLPNELKITNALVPALQSNWLLMHVTVMILSYASLLCGCLFSIAYLVLGFKFNPKLKQVTFQENPFDSRKFFQFHQKNKPNFINNLSLKQRPLTMFQNFEFETLDNLSYRFLGLGFPLLTIGILSGAVWANQTWGSYWSWDPKETWALITWFVFAIYLHTRLSKGWTGQKSALLASFGFLIIWVCYLGVNLMGKGLHSYGFLSS